MNKTIKDPQAPKKNGVKEINIGVDKNSGYMMASKVKFVAQEQITCYHPHLYGASLACLFRLGSWKYKEKEIAGKAYVVPEVWRAISGYDLVIVINHKIWTGLNSRGREALVDHELSHFAEPHTTQDGRLRYSIREHDLEEFSSVVNRYGICNGDPLTLVETARRDGLTSLSALARYPEDEEMADFEGDGYENGFDE